MAPTILLTGRLWATSMTAKELGVVRLMLKPLDLNELDERIDHCHTTLGR
jgi:hypothetical protein